MGQHVLPGNPPVEITVKKSARARRISLRVSRVDGRVTLTVPRGVSEREALAFAHDKSDWLRDTIRGQGAAHVVEHGARIPLLGEMLVITPGTGRLVRRDEGALIVPGDADRVGPRVQAYLKAQARDRLADASDRYAAALGRGFSRLTLRDTRSRWGSCTTDGGLMYSWRLIMAPLPVLDYVAAHEVAHLAEMNHSPAFWAVVHRLYGDHRAARGWLRAHGGDLHRFRF